MQLALIRHTRLKAEGLCYGRYDPPLAESFEQETRALAEKLAGLPSMSFHCSPSARCRRLAERLGVQAQHDPRLLELDFGDWDGRLWADIPRGESDAWAANFVHQAPPNGESYAALQTRAVHFLQEIQASGATHVGIISHAGVIRACIAHLRGIPLEQSFKRIPIGFGEIIQIEADPA